MRTEQPSFVTRSKQRGPPSPLKRVKACKGRRLFTDTQTRKISPLGQSRLLLPLGRNDKEGIILRDPFDCAALAMPPPLRSG